MLNFDEFGDLNDKEVSMGGSGSVTETAGPVVIGTDMKPRFTNRNRIVTETNWYR